MPPRLSVRVVITDLADISIVRTRITVGGVPQPRVIGLRVWASVLREANATCPGMWRQ